MRERLDGLSLDAIMTRWPATIRVFIDWRMRCVGCPIAAMHSITESAVAHGYPPAALEQALEIAIRTGTSPAAPLPPRRQSAAGDADP